MPASPDLQNGGQSRSVAPERARKRRASSGSGSAEDGRSGGGPSGSRRSQPDASGLLERIPPQDIEAEVATLGSMLLDAEASGVAAEQLTPDDFYRNSHKILFEAICAIYDAGQQPDNGPGRQNCIIHNLKWIVHPLRLLPGYREKHQTRITGKS